MIAEERGSRYALGAAAVFEHAGLVKALAGYTDAIAGSDNAVGGSGAGEIHGSPWFHANVHAPIGAYKEREIGVFRSRPGAGNIEDLVRVLQKQAHTEFLIGLGEAFVEPDVRIFDQLSG